MNVNSETLKCYLLFKFYLDSRNKNLSKLSLTYSYLEKGGIIVTKSLMKNNYLIEFVTLADF